MAQYDQETNVFITQLYDQYNRYTYKLAWQYCKFEYEVSDLVQEVWLKLYLKAEKLLSLSPEQQISYISTTLRNTALSYFRKENITLPLDSANGVAINEPDILDRILDRRSNIQRFYQLWTLVPQPARELLERKYFLEETDAEIAIAMGIGRNSVRMYLTRARKTAYSVLAEHKEAIM